MCDTSFCCLNGALVVVRIDFAVGVVRREDEFFCFIFSHSSAWPAVTVPAAFFPPVLKCANFSFGGWFWENVVAVSALAKVWFFDLDLAVQVGRQVLWSEF